jgi:uncharacterized protein YbjT (DUF2867 family)
MKFKDKKVLVLGATGQQGGSVATALLAQGWQVRAMVRSPDSAKAKALHSAGAEVMRGDQSERASLEAAIAGCWGVYSVQPSSGQGPSVGVSDANEVRFGQAVADIAEASGVQHLVYSSANASGLARTGMGHFDTKREIERHVRSLSLRHTIIRPAAFMEILMLPGMGLDQGKFSFFMQPKQAMQFIAVEDIGRIVAGVFAAPEEFDKQTFEIAGDALTGEALAATFTQAAGRPISYERFPAQLLADNAFLGGLARLVDDGRLTGHAELTGLRERFPGLLSVDHWLAGAGGALLHTAVRAGATEVALR